MQRAITNIKINQFLRSFVYVKNAAIKCAEIVRFFILKFELQTFLYKNFKIKSIIISLKLNSMP